MKRRIFLLTTVFTIILYPVVSFAGDDSCKKKLNPLSGRDHQPSCRTGSTGWNPPSAGPIVTWTAPVCCRNELDVQPFFYYNRTRGTFDSEGHYKSYKNKDRKWQWQQALFLQYGLTDRLEAGALGQIQENIRHVDGASAEAFGFADTWLYTRYCFIGESAWMPHTTGVFQLKIPTGKHQKADGGKLGTDLMGSTQSPGSYDYGFGAMLTKHIKPFILHADFAYNIPMPTKIDGVKVRNGNYVSFDFGAEYFLPKNFNLMVEFNWLAGGDKKYDGELKPTSDIYQVQMAPGIGWSNDKIQTLLAYQRTIAGTNVDVNDSIIFTFVSVF